MNANETVRALNKGDHVMVIATVTNITFTKGETYDLVFLGWFGPQPLFRRESDGVTVPYFAFEAGHITF
ncbi:hypothetical protein [Microbacterium sp. AK031]|uniref:hypothetical protein n=1 Tax=Microbacterium sp. AK031 TaxID=2723076 RepID=UPI00216943A0|nr:hypothetical protein [Microbacterium sp. AK031]MCS3844800.1 hypothetical protein [Microbacterium sp. AK031]